MIDTVCFRRFYQIKRSFLSLPDAPEGWTHTTKTGTTPTGYYRKHIFAHGATGLRAILNQRPKDGVNQELFIEVSLPRVLFKSNGRLITTQAQIDDAIQRVEELVAQVADVATIRIGRRKIRYPRTKFRRVDLCWQIKGCPRDFIRAYQGFKYPGVHKLPETYGHQTIRWSGSEMNISFYDKSQEIRDSNRNHNLPKTAKGVVRIEVQLLTSRKVGKCLVRGNSSSKLDLKVCYRALRKLLQPFAPHTIFRVSNIWDIYFFAVSEKWKIGGRPAIDFLLEEYSAATRAKYLKRLQKTRAHSYKIDWQKELPPTMPRPIVNHGVSFSVS